MPDKDRHIFKAPPPKTSLLGECWGCSKGLPSMRAQVQRSMLLAGARDFLRPLAGLLNGSWPSCCAHGILMLTWQASCCCVQAWTS